MIDGTMAISLILKLFFTFVQESEILILGNTNSPFLMGFIYIIVMSEEEGSLVICFLEQ